MRGENFMAFIKQAQMVQWIFFPMHIFLLGSNSLHRCGPMDMYISFMAIFSPRVWQTALYIIWFFNEDFSPSLCRWSSRICGTAAHFLKMSLVRQSKKITTQQKSSILGCLKFRFVCCPLIWPQWNKDGFFYQFLISMQSCRFISCFICSVWKR